MNQKIDYEEIVKLIDLIDKRGLSEFALEIEGFKIQMAKNSVPSPAIPAPSSENAPSMPPNEAGDEAKHEGHPDYHYISSPMVGTFYRAPDPSSPSFVEVGDLVDKNQTLCIIEAMKLMNEIEADISGTIVEIYIENGKPIEYGQKLFAIKAD